MQGAVLHTRGTPVGPSPLPIDAHMHAWKRLVTIPTERHSLPTTSALPHGMDHCHGSHHQNQCWTAQAKGSASPKLTLYPCAHLPGVPSKHSAPLNSHPHNKHVPLPPCYYHTLRAHIVTQNRTRLPKTTTLTPQHPPFAVAAGAAGSVP
jgi:hypothetical protein